MIILRRLKFICVMSRETFKCHFLPPAKIVNSMLSEGKKEQYYMCFSKSHHLLLPCPSKVLLEVQKRFCWLRLFEPNQKLNLPLHCFGTKSEFTNASSFYRSQTIQAGPNFLGQNRETKVTYSSLGQKKNLYTFCAKPKDDFHFK